MRIPAEVLDSMQGGLSLLVACCDAQGRPLATRGVGMRVWPSEDRITLFLAQSCAEPVASSLRERPRIAFVTSRPHDYRTVQLKGTALAVREAAPEDRALVDAFVRTFAELVDGLGVPREIALRVNHWPCLAIDIAIEQVFVQTPGPGAGSAVTGAGS